MNYIVLLALVSTLLGPTNSWTQHSFSIVAIDLPTRQVGGAIGSCVSAPSAFIFSVHPGIGIITTQGVYDSLNQAYAHNLMIQGLDAQAIIDSLVVNDIAANPEIRQYGIAMLGTEARHTAAYTGENVPEFHGQILGQYYAIQGNILQGPQILEAMESHFLATEGPLENRLMAALQGAKIVGADVRCEAFGYSSLTAALVVSHPGDLPNNPYLELSWYNQTEVTELGNQPDAIDALQVLFDKWKIEVTSVSRNTWGEIKHKYFRHWPLKFVTIDYK